MINPEHTHISSPDSNTCKDCGESIHIFENPKKSFDAKSLNKASDGLNKIANKIGIALVLVVVGLLLFPLGIILWVFAIGVIISAFSQSKKD